MPDMNIVSLIVALVVCELLLRVLVEAGSVIEVMNGESIQY